MIKSLIALVAIAGSTAATVAPPASYAGNWTLDAAKSTGLPSYYSRVKSHKLAIVQTPEKLDVHVIVDAGMEQPDKIDFSYLLDGSEVSSETVIRGPGGMTPVPTKLKALPSANGGIDITISRHITMGPQPFDAVTTEAWQLADDGKTLIVHRIDDSPMGHVDAKMVFTRS